MPKVAKQPFCDAGLHRVKVRGHCEACLIAAERSLSALQAEEYRQARRAQLGLGPPPTVLTMTTGDGRRISFDSRPRRR